MFKVIFNYGEVGVKLESMRPHLRKQKSETGTLSVSSTPLYRRGHRPSEQLGSFQISENSSSNEEDLLTSPARILCEPLRGGTSEQLLFDS